MLNKFLRILLIVNFLTSCSYQPNSLKQKINAIVTKANFSGVILVAQGHKTLYKNASGFASRRFNYPNNIDTKFNLSSIGKLFTSVAIAKLVLENELSLDTRIDKILPEWNVNDNLKYITIKDLLTHQSGLDNFMNDERWKSGADYGLFVETLQHKQLIASEKQDLKPGTSVKYSNSGYLLLGAVIEKISNQS